MHRLNSRHGGDALVHVGERNVRGRRLEQHVAALLHETPRAAEHQHPDEHRDQRICHSPMKSQDDYPREECAHRAEQVAEHVQVGGPLIERLVVIAVQDERGTEIRDEPDKCHAEEQRTVDDGRRPEAMPRLDADADRDREQDRAVHQRGEDLESQESERSFRRRGDQCQSERGHVGEHVGGIGEQRERARHPSAGQLDHHHHRGDGERERQAPSSLDVDRRAIGAVGFSGEHECFLGGKHNNFRA